MKLLAYIHEYLYILRIKKLQYFFACILPITICYFLVNLVGVEITKKLHSAKVKLAIEKWIK